MSPIEDLYKQAQLAEAAYANFLATNKWGQVHISHFQHSFRREASLACGSSSLRSARHAL
jgi:hypothetical protein